jgi:hypothetical protein
MSVNGIPRGDPILVSVTQVCLETISKELLAVSQTCYPTNQAENILNNAFCSNNCTNANQAFLNVVKTASVCSMADNLDEKWNRFQSDRRFYCKTNAADSEVAKTSSSVSMYSSLFLFSIFLI